MRYAAIREHEGVFAVTTMCRALGVSLDGIRRIHAQSHENYGGRKLWRALVASGERCGRHRVARLCSAYGIAAKRMRRFRSVYRSEQRPAAPNLLQRHGSLRLHRSVL